MYVLPKGEVTGIGLTFNQKKTKPESNFFLHNVRCLQIVITFFAEMSNFGGILDRALLGCIQIETFICIFISKCKHL